MLVNYTADSCSRIYIAFEKGEAIETPLSGWFLLFMFIMYNCNRMRIICDPYEKTIRYEWFNNEMNEFLGIDGLETKLTNEKYTKATIQNRAFEIVEIINSDFYVGNAKLQIEFVGNQDDYDDLKHVIDTYYADANIECIKSGSWFNDADTVMGKIKERFSEVKSTLEEYQEDSISGLIQKYEDTVKPSIAICVMGLYSAGKSAFINSLIGEELLPSASDPTTARIYCIENAESPQLYMQINGQDCFVTFDDDKFTVNGFGAQWIERKLKSVEPKDGVSVPVYLIYKLISDINNESVFSESNSSEPLEIGDIVHVKLPFVSSSMPIDKFNFIIYDTPGSNSDTNKKHLEVLANSLSGQTNSLPVFLTTPDTMDSTDNQMLLDMIKDTGDALDTTNAIIVVNKSDEKGANALSAKREKCEDLKITKWKSTRVFFVSSIIALAAKKRNPHDDSMWIDEDMFEIFDDKCRKYECGDRKLYVYNIVDKSKAGFDENDTNLTDNEQLFRNSGLASVEAEFADYAQRYALYNKCKLATDYLSKAAALCETEVAEKKRQLNQDLEAQSDQYTRQENRLIETIANYKLAQSNYNITEYDKRLRNLYEEFKKDKNIIYNLNPFDDIPQLNETALFREFGEQWNQFSTNAQLLGYDNSYAINNMQKYVGNRYNMLLDEFSEIANEFSEAFWQERMTVIKKIIGGVVVGSQDFNEEQKEILDSVIREMDNMNTERVSFTVDDDNGIVMNILALFNLFSAYNNIKCCASFIRKLDELTDGRIKKVIEQNGRNFDSWSTELIDKIKLEILKFSKTLSDSHQEIENIRDDIDVREKHLALLKETGRYVSALLTMQSGETAEE